jgi:predicted anti-sigma-YlaC factor YlaD
VREHNEFRELLALSAAGLLDAAEERQVREHARECSECAAELEALGDLAAALAVLPAPAPPSDLLPRTQARVAADRDRREAQRLAIAAALCAATMTAAVCALAQSYFGPMVWVAATVIPTIPAAIVAAMLKSRSHAERSA